MDCFYFVGKFMGWMKGFKGMDVKVFLIGIKGDFIIGNIRDGFWDIGDIIKV